MDDENAKRLAREQIQRDKLAQQNWEKYTAERKEQTNRTPGPCFVATAVFESSECEQVAVLRLWRDIYLRRHSLGWAFIKLYGLIGPPLAWVVSRIPPLKWASRIVLDYVSVRVRHYILRQWL
jgi:hypothetical protein